MGLLDAGITYENVPDKDLIPRKRIGIMGVALGVFLGNIFTAILGGVVYYLGSH